MLALGKSPRLGKLQFSISVLMGSKNRKKNLIIREYMLFLLHTSVLVDVYTYKLKSKSTGT